jgi:hypothetical protein
LANKETLLKGQVTAYRSSSSSTTPTNAHNNKLSTHKKFRSIDGSLKNSSKNDQRKFSWAPFSITSAVYKFSYCTKTGYIPGKGLKLNQDSHFAHINFASQSDMYLFGVCDGHGHYGGEVSNYIKHRLPVLISSDPNIISNIKLAITNSISKCNFELN